MRSILVWVLLSLVLTFSVLPQPAAAAPGAPSKADVKDEAVIRAARFAVKAQQQVLKDAGKTEKLALVKVVSAEKQVVAGMNYILKLKVKQDDKLRTVDVKVWEQAWRKEPYKLTSWKWLPAEAAP